MTLERLEGAALLLVGAASRPWPLCEQSRRHPCSCHCWRWLAACTRRPRYPTRLGYLHQPPSPVLQETPTLLFFPAEAGAEPIAYEGDRSLLNLTRFIKQHAKVRTRASLR